MRHPAKMNFLTNEQINALPKDRWFLSTLFGYCKTLQILPETTHTKKVISCQTCRKLQYSDQWAATCSSSTFFWSNNKSMLVYERPVNFGPRHFSTLSSSREELCAYHETEQTRKRSPGQWVVPRTEHVTWPSSALRAGYGLPF